jgi:hypothetical protein
VSQPPGRVAAPGRVTDEQANGAGAGAQVEQQGRADDHDDAVEDPAGDRAGEQQ